MIFDGISVSHVMKPYRNHAHSQTPGSVCRSVIIDAQAQPAGNPSKDGTNSKWTCLFKPRVLSSLETGPEWSMPTVETSSLSEKIARARCEVASRVPAETRVGQGRLHRPQANATRGAQSVHFKDGIARAPGAGGEPGRQRRSSGKRCDPREAVVAFTVGELGLGRAGEKRDGQGRVGGSRDP
jgi:hypothetical protein